MRGVLSVLGLDQASLAVVRMRDTVERLLINEVPEEGRQAVFEKLGNSLGALGFLIDMLSYQRTMARKLLSMTRTLASCASSWARPVRAHRMPWRKLPPSWRSAPTRWCLTCCRVSPWQSLSANPRTLPPSWIWGLPRQ